MTGPADEQAGGDFWAPHELACALTLGAGGLTCERAGVELLIDTGTWLRRDDFTGPFVTVDTSVATARAFIDWEAAIAALDAGGLACGGGERRILRISASMSGGVLVDLRDALTGLDVSNLELVAAAVRQANRSRAACWNGEEA